MRRFFLHLSFSLSLLAGLAANADQSFTITWKTLMQDHFVGRVRSIGWGASTVYDYNTPFFVEVSICPVWNRSRGDSTPVTWHDISIGNSRRMNSQFWDSECRALATSSSHTTWDGKVTELNEALTFTESSILSAIQSLKNPGFLVPEGVYAVEGEVGYILRVMVISDYSILPLWPRQLGRIGMRTATNIIANHLVELPITDVGVPGMEQQTTYEILRQVGSQVHAWSPGQRLEHTGETLSYSIEVGSK